MSIFSISVPADDISLLTIEELRAAVGATDNSQDDTLEIVGDRVSTAIARQCNVVDDGINPPTLLSEICTEVFRWTGCGPLKLARRPVTSILSVTIAGEVVGSDEYELRGRDLYALSDDEISEWQSGKITVVYGAGYETAPDDLKLAATKLVTATYSENGRDPTLKREEVDGAGQLEYWVSPSNDPFLSKQIADLIGPYVERFL